ncbi:unnamed protein product [Symbiodinium necroappetens]|uniref:Uncharacterized protein n=1 Tax=Symbiodinium necroappetens TaxID=1628268 RepID=A0A812PI60_9DINO|nr:unnamed protein product [Symbiodinium necroappetens]
MKFNGVSLVELGSNGSSRVPCETQRRFAVADQPPGWSAFVQDWQLVDDMAGRPTLGRHKSNQRSPRGPCLARCGSLWPQDERKQENQTGLPDGPLSVYALTASPLLSGRVPTMTNKQPGQQQPRSTRKCHFQPETRCPPCFRLPARGMGAERKQLCAAKKALDGIWPGSGGLYGAVNRAVEDPGKWLKGVARWLETSEDTDPVRVFTVCCDDFRPRRLKAPVVLAWLTVQLLGLIFQVILWLEVGRNLESFEDTLAQNCAPSLQQHGICLGPAWNLSYSGTLSFPPGESQTLGDAASAQGAKAMEVQVEAMPGWEVPKGCLVGVRLGEALKQRRLDGRSASNYVFPKQDGKRRARIDVYRHVGSCSVEVDPSSINANEVNVPCSDPSLQSIRLRITSQAAGSSSEEQRQRQQEQESKESALNYLAAHDIEQTLAESVRQMLKLCCKGSFGHHLLWCSKLEPEVSIEVVSVVQDHVLPRRVLLQSKARTQSTATRCTRLVACTMPGDHIHCLSFCIEEVPDRRGGNCTCLGALLFAVLHSIALRKVKH